MADPVQAAEAYLELGRPEDALAVVGPLLAGGSTDVRLLCTAARAELAAGRPSRAESLLADAIALAPDADQPYRVLANAAARRRDWTAARWAASEAVQRAPDEWRAHYTTAWIGLAAGSLGHDELQAQDRALALAPDEPSVHVLAGRISMARRRHHDASDHLRAALRIAPDDLEAQELLARCEMQNGRLGEALGRFAAVARAKPSRGAVTGIESAVSAALFRTHALLGLLSFGLVALLSHLEHDAPAVTAVALAGGVAVPVLTAGTLLLQLRRARQDARRAARTALRQHWFFPTWIAILALQVAAFCALPVLLVPLHDLPHVEALLGAQAAAAIVLAVAFSVIASTSTERRR